MRIYALQFYPCPIVKITKKDTIYRKTIGITKVL